MGIPLEPDGRRGKEAQRAMALAHELKSRLGLEVLIADESYSTLEALELLNSPGAAKKAGPGAKDSFAAAVILERKLEGLRRGAAKKGDRG